MLPKAQWREYYSSQARWGLCQEPTMFETLHSSQVAKGESIWGRFLDKGDWEVAQWIVELGMTHTLTNKFLELKKVSKIFIVESRLTNTL